MGSMPSSLTTQLIDTFVLPPGGFLLLALLGLLAIRARLGQQLLALAVLLLWLFSMPVTERLLRTNLEQYPALTQTEIEKATADAIVVLGADRYYDAPEYAEDSAGQNTLFRLRYAAWLAKHSGLPVIPSGGLPRLDGLSEAQIMQKVLQSDYGLQIDDIEQRSRSTWENARYTAQVLQKTGMKRIILVTHASHMPRAVYAFERNGIGVLPAPTGFWSRIPERPAWLDYMPSAQALNQVHAALHEYLGLAWYQFN